jgi:hypothetical protein
VHAVRSARTVDSSPRVSATNVARLTAGWEREYRAFKKRSLADRDYF